MFKILDPSVETNEYIQQCLQDWLDKMGDNLSKEDQDLVQAQIRLNEYLVGPEAASWRELFLKFVNSSMRKSSIISREKKFDILLSSREELKGFDIRSYNTDEYCTRDKIPIYPYFANVQNWGGRHLTLHRATRSKITPGSLVQGDLVKDLVELKNKTPLILGALATMLLQGARNTFLIEDGNSIFFANLGGIVTMILVEYDSQGKKFLVTSNYPGNVKVKPADLIFHLPLP